MYRFEKVPIRSVAGRVGTHNLAAVECLALGEAVAPLIQFGGGSAVVVPGAAVTRPGEARAR
jgi:hypothetical protein